MLKLKLKTMSNMVMLMINSLDSEEKKQWLDAMQDEMKSLHDNHTYDLVKLPKGKRALVCCISPVKPPL